jgi:hypothetical protein
VNCILLSAFVGRYIDRMRHVENHIHKVDTKWVLLDTTSTHLKDMFMDTLQ